MRRNATGPVPQPAPFLRRNPASLPGLPVLTARLGEWNRNGILPFNRSVTRFWMETGHRLMKGPGLSWPLLYRFQSVQLGTSRRAFPTIPNSCDSPCRELPLCHPVNRSEPRIECSLRHPSSYITNSLAPRIGTMMEMMIPATRMPSPTISTGSNRVSRRLTLAWTSLS